MNGSIQVTLILVAGVGVIGTSLAVVYVSLRAGPSTLNSPDGATDNSEM